MKMKYTAVLLTSMGLIAMAASVPAQQNAQLRERAKNADIAPVGADIAPVSADMAPVEVGKQPYYSPDVDPLISPRQRNLFSRDGVGWNDEGSPQRNQIAVQEAALAHEMTQIRQRLDAATTDAQRSEIRTKLAENLAKQFDLRQKRHGLEIETLESQVKKLKDLVKKRQESRDEIISRRVDQILREAEGLGW